MATKKTTTTAIDVPEAPTREPSRVVLCWADDTPARLASLRDLSAQDTTQPTLRELEEGQLAAHFGLDITSREMENLESLCCLLADSLDHDARVDRLKDALSVVGDRIRDIRFRLDEHSEAIVPLYNLSAWYHRSVAAQNG